jgi:hypothetical protein
MLRLLMKFLADLRLARALLSAKDKNGTKIREKTKDLRSAGNQNRSVFNISKTDRRDSL